MHTVLPLRPHNPVDPADLEVLTVEKDASLANTNRFGTYTLKKFWYNFVSFIGAWKAILGMLLGPSRS